MNHPTLSTSIEKSTEDSGFPHKGHLWDKPSIKSFNGLSSVIVLIIFPQLPHSMSTDKTTANKDVNIIFHFE